nr:Fe-S-containing protein [Volucribacter amazonae]
MWSKYKEVNLASLVKLTLLAIVISFGLHYLPQDQITKFSINSSILAILCVFLITQWLSYPYLAYLWHLLLLCIAWLVCFNNPNFTAISQIDVINTDFILHLFAILAAIIICLLISCWLYLSLRQLKTFPYSTALFTRFIPYLCFILLLAFIVTPIIGEITLNLIKLQIIELTKARLSFIAQSTQLIQLSNYFTSILLLFISIYSYCTLYQGYKFTLAERDIITKRQKQAKLEQIKTLIISGILASLISLTSQLYWDYIASQPPKLSAAKTVTLNEHQQISIPIEQVKDGKLHRFVWISDEGKTVRFFIINRLADKLSLAVVFDACLLCGDQGYIMQDNQVICIGCGVYMFTPSIGKAGGCNPVPIENWQQTEQSVIIPKTSLETGLMLFSTIVEQEVIDPVDQSKLTNNKAPFKYSYAGKTYFFATEQNLEKFRANPSKFIPLEEQ